MKNKLWLGIITGLMATGIVLFFSKTGAIHGNAILLRNLWLAIPCVVLSYVFTIKHSARWILLPVWLWLMPYSFYVITDLKHLFEHTAFNKEMWLQIASLDLSAARGVLLIDTFKFLLFGISAWFLGAYSVLQVLENWPHRKSRKYAFWIFCALGGLGVIIGRVFRHDAIDIFSTLQLILDDVLSIFTNPILLGYWILLALAISMSVGKSWR